MKKNSFIVFLMMAVLMLFVVSCSNHDSNDVSEAQDVLKKSVQRVISLNILGDKEIKENASYKSEHNDVMYSGKNGDYIFDATSGTLKMIVRKEPVENAGDEKTIDELSVIADSLLEKINKEFSENDLELEKMDLVDSVRIIYKERKNDILQPNRCVIELERTGELITYSYVSIDKYKEDNSEYKVTHKDAVALAKKDFLKRFSLDQKSFEKKQGEIIEVDKVNHKGKNAWKISIAYVDGCDKGGTYFIDGSELNIIEFISYK